jgi:hypothetical protein
VHDQPYRRWPDDLAADTGARGAARIAERSALRPGLKASIDGLGLTALGQKALGQKALGQKALGQKALD